MSYKVDDIVHEAGRFWVLRVTHGYDVYQQGITHSIRIAQFGRGDDYRQRAIELADKRSLEAA